MVMSNRVIKLRITDLARIDFVKSYNAIKLFKTEV